LHIIPVIDLLNGIVVHAKKGMRQHYQPIQSQLGTSHQPLDVVKALLDFYPFTQLYIADLNAIQKIEGTYNSNTGNTNIGDTNLGSANFKIIEAIIEHHPTLTLWVDAGISNKAELNIWEKLKARLVFGSENFACIDDYLLLNSLKNDYILSLDFFPEGYRGPKELLTNIEYWPQDVIVMTLSNVGANGGVNSELLNDTLTRAKDFSMYAAGGVRNIEDLKLLKSMGIKGVLIATAIHQQQLSSDDIKSLSQ
jgi:phosphoribosylformimino-5-aminoimidazole carboxamide ribotide isomerase